MANEDEATLTIGSVPAALKGKIAKRAERDSSNMRDILVGILCDHYGIAFEPGGRKRHAIGLASRLVLDIPAELKEAIEEDAHEYRDTQRNVAMEIICASFGVKFTPTGRWVEATA